MKRLIFFALFSMIVAVSQAFAGGAAAVGATEGTQLLNKLQLLQSYEQQLEQYSLMLQNLQKMTPSYLLDAAARKLWRDQNMSQVFSNLRGMVVNGQRIAYTLSNVESQFRKIHPGYSDYTEANQLDFFQSYKDWSDNTLDAVKDSLSLMTAHAENFASEEGTMQELMQKSDSAKGQLAALQAGHAVSMHMVGQMQKLNQLQMAQMKVQSSYVSGKQSAEDKKVKGLKKIFGGLTSNKIKQ